MGKIYKNGIEYGGGGGSAAGGHTILDNDGNTMPTEDNLQFKGLDVTDNSTDGVTEVESAGLNQDSMDDVLSASASGVQVASDGMSYSTEEQVVGRWIDGKPLYQKTISFTTPSAVGQFDIAGVSNIEMLVSLTGFLHASNSWDTRINSYQDAQSYNFFNFNVDTNRFYFKTNESNYFSCPAYITIQYTKSTD